MPLRRSSSVDIGCPHGSTVGMSRSSIAGRRGAASARSLFRKIDVHQFRQRWALWPMQRNADDRQQTLSNNPGRLWKAHLYAVPESGIVTSGVSTEFQFTPFNRPASIRSPEHGALPCLPGRNYSAQQQVHSGPMLPPSNAIWPAFWDRVSLRMQSPPEPCRSRREMSALSPQAPFSA